MSTKNPSPKANVEVAVAKKVTGSTLKSIAHPDQVIEYDILTYLNCGKELASAPDSEYEPRQVVDVEPVKVDVTEHRARIRPCSYCGQLNKGIFSEAVTQLVQYGPRIRSWIVYFSHYQLLPYKRLQEMMRDVLGIGLSQRTISNLQKSCYNKLECFEHSVKEQLIQSDVVHFDETGMCVNKDLYWMLVACTMQPLSRSVSRLSQRLS